jgi:hypothetical protein
MRVFKRYLFPLLLLLVSLGLAGCTLPFARQNYAGLQVESTPQSSVYLDGKHVGTTKYYETKLKPAEYIVKIVPLDTALAPWETQVKLVSGQVTIINREFGASPAESSDYTIQLEKRPTKKVAELTIITTPESVIVRLDDQPKGFSPLTNLNLTPDNHKVTLNYPGHKTMNINVTGKAGYRTLLTAELAKALALQPQATNSATPVATESATPATPSASPKASPTPTPKTSPSPTPTPTPKPSPQVVPAKPYVEILTTPTGWLRVRSEPNGLTENEVARVNTGQMFPYIESNDTGWHKIEYETGKQGWVAASYTKVVK